MQFQVKLSGARIQDKKAPIDVLGKFLINFQGLLNEIIRADDTLPKKARARKEVVSSIQVFATHIGGGSATVDLAAETPVMLDSFVDKKPAARSASFFVKTFLLALAGINIIQSVDEKDAYLNFEKKFPNQARRVRILNRYLGMYPPNDVIITIKPSMPTSTEMLDLQGAYTPRVKNWIRQELGSNQVSMTGVIKRIKTDGSDKYFTFFNEHDKAFTCKYDDELYEKILEVFNTPVNISGVLVTRGARSLLKSIEMIEPVDAFTFSPEMLPALKQPLDFSLTFDTKDEYFIAENDDLGIRAVTKHFGDLDNEIATHLDFMIDRYIVQQYSKVNDKLRKAIDYLTTIIDLSKFDTSEHWVEDDEV